MKIRMYTSPKLRTICSPIEKITPEIKKLAKRMVRYVEKNVNCVGLAAPQVGHTIQLIVARMQLTDDDGSNYRTIEVMLNPRIDDASEAMETEKEGCLSCPGEMRAVARHKRVAVSYMNLDGELYSLLLSGMPARVVQHEIDHLNGILIIDPERSSESLK